MKKIKKTYRYQREGYRNGYSGGEGAIMRVYVSCVLHWYIYRRGVGEYNNCCPEF